MKTIKYIAMAACCLVLTTACEDFLDVNSTKDSPTTVTLDQALPVATFYAAQICYDHAEYGVYMSQALTTGAKAQTGSYPYSQGWEFLGVNRHPMWRRHFYDLGANIDKMVDMARNGNTPSPNYELIGRTIMLQSTMLTTDIFGEMPRAEAYKATSPRYDSQEEVYAWMFQEADELVRLYSDPAYTTGLPISEKVDRIYKGDMKKWGAYAKALRCRLWLRKFPNWENTPANAQKLAAMVDDVLNDPNWEEPRYHYPGGKTEQNCPWGPIAPVINSWESRGNRLASSLPTKFFNDAILGAYTSDNGATGIEDLETGANVSTRNKGYFALDPRATKIMEPREYTSTTGQKSTYLRGIESNSGIDVSEKTTYYPNLLPETGLNPFVLNTGYIALITEEELLFIKAEAQYWANDKTGAYATTLQAVEHNMDRYQVDRTSEPNRQIYELFKAIKLPETGFTLADLMQQKYIAMYLQPEQWTDLRRYNYSSSTNELKYGVTPADEVYVYVVTRLRNAKDLGRPQVKQEQFKAENVYALRRPYNLYAAYWDQPECYQNAEKTLLSDKAWVNRLNPDTETETKYNKAELIRIGACDASGKVDYHWMQKKMIWQ